jgi:hypothetical protein
MEAFGSVFYFAYGSNMSSSVFTHGFRNITPKTAERAILKGYRLAFSEPGYPIFEPAYANVEKDERAQCEGVLYRITPEEMDWLDQTEGGRAYNITSVSVEGSVSGTVTAQVFTSKAVAHGLLPSKRYMDILIHGAEEHGLSEMWITMLKNQRYVDRTHLRHLRSAVLGFILWTRRRGLPHPFRWWKNHHIRRTARKAAFHRRN